MCVAPLLIVTLVRFLQDWNARLLIVFTLEGMITLARLEPWNAPVPMEVTLVGIEIEVIELFRKAFALIEVIVEGSVTLFR